MLWAVRTLSVLRERSMRGWKMKGHRDLYEWFPLNTKFKLDWFKSSWDSKTKPNAWSRFKEVLDIWYGVERGTRRLFLFNSSVFVGIIPLMGERAGGAPLAVLQETLVLAFRLLNTRCSPSFCCLLLNLLSHSSILCPKCMILLRNKETLVGTKMQLFSSFDSFLAGSRQNPSPSPVLQSRLPRTGWSSCHPTWLNARLYLADKSTRVWKRSRASSVLGGERGSVCRRPVYSESLVQCSNLV